RLPINTLPPSDSPSPSSPFQLLVRQASSSSNQTHQLILLHCTTFHGGLGFPHVTGIYCDRARAMEYEDCLLQGAPYDILEEYFPRPNIVMPPPPQQVPEASQPIEPKQPGRKRVSRNEEDVNNGMTDEDIQAFLSTRSKRGRGSIGARVEKKSSSFSRLRTSSSSSSSYHEHCRRETDHGLENMYGQG
ncbi:hypothetical protein LINGRAPRIM_LOCUS1499, partial [Linum grandiflorum]